MAGAIRGGLSGPRDLRLRSLGRFGSPRRSIRQEELGRHGPGSAANRYRDLVPGLQPGGLALGILVTFLP
jgi:hypothetical protein